MTNNIYMITLFPVISGYMIDVVYLFVLSIIIFIIHNIVVKNISFLAIKDELTGLYTRKILSKIKNLEEYSIIIVDIDYFKKINDNYGHDTGDYVLKLIAQVLENTFRNNRTSNKDYTLRFGGEEFVILIHTPSLIEKELTKTAILQKLNNLLIKVQNMEIFTQDNSPRIVKLTISIGITFNFNKCNNFNKLFKIADEYLYFCKENGRNQIKYGELNDK